MGKIKPQLAQPAEEVSTDRRLQGWVMEPKVDGIRAILVKRGDEVRLYSRTGQDIETVPTIASDVSDLPYDIVLDGELVVVQQWFSHRDRRVPVVDFSKTMSAIRSGATKAAQVQRKTSVTFLAFDCLERERDTLSPTPDVLRRLVLEGAVRDINSTQVVVMPRWSAWTPSWYGDLVSRGVEGVVLKNPNAVYKAGKRPSNTWDKVKAHQTIDAVVMGFKEGKGDMEGLIGSLAFGQYRGGRLEPRGFCSGMNMGLRRAISESRDEYVGKVIEVRIFGRVGSNGDGIRHPQFLRIRDDKEPEECRWE